MSGKNEMNLLGGFTIIFVFGIYTVGMVTLGFHEGQKRYEVNLFIPESTSPKELRHNVKGYDACVKLKMHGSPICNCTVFDRGKE